MMVQTRRRRTREVTGPTPHSVAVFARPTNKKPPEYLILDRRKKEDQRQQAEEMTKYNKVFDLKNDWERWTDRKIQLNTVKRRVNNLMMANQFSIEDRREKLRDILSKEEQQYLSEMADKEETTLERQAKMRERAKLLKEQREAERMSFVHEKLEQQFRDQCEELRSTLSKRQQDEVAAERMEQLRIKDEVEKSHKVEEDMYAKLWYADMESKARREEADARRIMAGNKEMLEVLQHQMAALEGQKKEEKKLIEEEARLLDEQKQLRKIEELAAEEEKRRKQHEVREMYTRSLQLKKQKEAKEMQEQLAFDLKILEQLLEESRNEAMEQTQRKKELREEDRRYRVYLAQLKKMEKEHQEELERLVNAEVEKSWEKRLKQWRLEKQARQQLLQEVMQHRQTQLQEKLRANEMRQEEARQERDDLLQRIEENKRYEKEQVEKHKAQNVAYQSDLMGQMAYNERQRDLSRDEEVRIWQKQQEAEIEYRAKLEELRAKPDLNKMHPMRREVYSQSASAML